MEHYIFFLFVSHHRGTAYTKNGYLPHSLFDHVFRSFHIWTTQDFNCVVLAPLSMGRQILGWYYQNGPPKFIMNLLCPFHHFITPTVSINQFPDTGVCQNRCIAILTMQNCSVCCEIKSILLECRFI
jgi:hypothetical protein